MLAGAKSKVPNRSNQYIKRKAQVDGYMNTHSYICAWIDPDTKQEIVAYATHEKLSLAEAIRQLLEFGLETNSNGDE